MLITKEALAQKKSGGGANKRGYCEERNWILTVATAKPGRALLCDPRPDHRHRAIQAPVGEGLIGALAKKGGLGGGRKAAQQAVRLCRRDPNNTN